MTSSTTTAPATFTCDACGANGSLRWMGTHPCGTIADLATTGGRCEDYPCCGHTDGDGCAPLESHTADYWRHPSRAAHLSCDHEEGFYDCQDEDYDDED